MRRILTVLLTIACLCSMLAGCTGNEGTKGVAETGEASNEAQDVEIKKESYGLGETAVLDSYKITAESCKYITSDNQFMQPDEGKKFLEVTFLIENTSNKDLNVSSMLGFDAYLDDMSIGIDIMGQGASEQPTMDGTVATGKKLRGSLCYQVSESWSELEIVVDLDLLKSGNDTKFILKNEQ